MKWFLLALMTATLASAQNLTFAIHDSTGVNADTPLPSNYDFASAAQGTATPITLKMTNSGTVQLEVVAIYIGNEPKSPVANPNFSVVGAPLLDVIAPGDFRQFQVNFTPSTTGQLSGYLQVTYLKKTATCSFDQKDNSPCPNATEAISTLTGTGTAPQLLLTYIDAKGVETPQPNAASRLDFGSVSTSSSATFTFSLTNETAQSLPTPAITLANKLYFASAFALDKSGVADSIPANGSVTFKVTFAPGQTGFTYAVLTVGNTIYNLQGVGVALTPIDALAIEYVDSTGVRTQPEAATAISFGQLVGGVTSSATLKFTVTNPSSSYDAFTLSTLTVSGAAFTMSGSPSLPAVIQPGASISFSLTFSQPASGTYNGVLSIGTRQFNLTGQTLASSLPGFTFNSSEQTLTSQSQVNLGIQAAAGSSFSGIGTLTMSFAPAVSGVSDDPAVMFVATGGRQLQVTFVASSVDGTFENQSAIAFQTGTTAGTLTFTLTFANNAPVTKSFTITPAPIQIATAVAERQSPSLILTITGYDNTYSAGQMSFTFYDAKGKAIAKAMPVDASSQFHSFFFTDNSAGGAFSMQANFPVVGDVTKIASVAVALTNSAGEADKTLQFQ